MPTKAGGRLLRGFLEVQREVPHQTLGGLDRAHMLTVRQRVHVRAPHPRHDLRQAIELGGRDALHERIPMRPTSTARAWPIAGREL